MQYTARHSLLSVSYCSNIPGHTAPVCLVRSRGREGVQVAKLVGKFVDGLLKCAATASRIMRSRYSEFMAKIDSEIQRLEKMESLYKKKERVTTGRGSAVILRQNQPQRFAQSVSCKAAV